MGQGLQMHQIELKNGETLAYRERPGKGKAILLIHGNMSSSRHWQPLYNRLPQDYHLIGVDLRGMGQSTYHHSFDSLEELGEDLAALIQEKGLKDVVLVGWSTGGGVAMELAANHPQLIDRVVLVESVGYKGYPIPKRDASGNLLPGEVYGSKEEMATDPVQVAPMLRAMAEKDYALMTQVWDQAIYVHEKPEAEEYKALLEATFQQRNLLDIDWALANFNLSHEHNGYSMGNGKIDLITQPVLSLWGDSDYVVTEAMVRETVEAIGANATMVVLPKCGHSPLVDCPQALTDHIVRFIEER